MAEAGLLRVGEEHAVQVLHAAGTGAVTTLLQVPPERRDLAAADTLWEATAWAILTDEALAGRGAPAEGEDVIAAAVRLRAHSPALPGLSPGERSLLSEWLDRSVKAGRPAS